MKSNITCPPTMDYRTFKLIADGIMGNILVADKSGDVIFCNVHCADIFGIKETELLEVNVHKMYKDKMIDKMAASSETIKKKQPLVRYIKTKEGRGMLIHCQPVFDESGELEMVVAFSHEEHDFNDFVKIIESEKQQLQKVMNYLGAVKESSWFVSSKNHEMQRLYQFAFTSARSDSTICIYGETGTGKEVLANFIHRNSARASGAFIPVNCAAIPEELMESEFFGYSAYSFTGANKQGKAGIFEIANKGTLFLDEIGELPLSMQSKLLRVLETGEIRRVGSAKQEYTDVRIIVATNRNLADLAKTGKFREDLYYRINVIPFNVPPLRDRREDIVPLSDYLLQEFNKKQKTKCYFSEDTYQYFLNYDWPGNVRELKNIIERLMVIAIDDELQIEDAVNTSYFTSGFQKYQTDHVESGTPKTPSSGTYKTLKKATMDFQLNYINQTIKHFNGNMTDAANALGIHRSNLYKLLNKMRTPDSVASG